MTDEEGPCAAWMSQLAELRAPVGGKNCSLLEGCCVNNRTLVETS